MDRTILDHLIALFPEARKTTLRAMIEEKRVLANGVPVRSLKQPLRESDKVEVMGAEAARCQPLLIGERLRLVHFDGEIAVVQKPAGLLTATDAQEQRPTALALLRNHFKKQNPKNRVYLVHRLDQAASGLLVFARTADAYRALKDQFLRHSITRRYDAIVHGVPAPVKGRLEHRLFEDAQGMVHVTADPDKGKEAVLEYLVIQTDRSKKLAHVQCTLHTGRKHQIRVQLATAGHAVCGDGVYGKGDEPPGRLALHASHLALDHPRSGRRIAFESAMPGSFAGLVHG